jgi:hypothetical protein
MINISKRLNKLIDEAMDIARFSQLHDRHGAVMFNTSGKIIVSKAHNKHGNNICGYDVPSIHAEANCIQMNPHRFTKNKGKRHWCLL